MYIDKKNLVSVVIPCYNMESKAHRLFDSLLEQTYKNLQIIIVNDGSKDETEKLVFEYKSLFEEQGYSFKYIYQENAGPGAALENGLKYVEGEFLIWPDADDYLYKDSIKKSLNFLLNNEDYAFVKTDGYIFDSNDLSTPLRLLSKGLPSHFKEANLIEDYILEKDVYFCPICFMIRFSYFKEVNPELYIYHGRLGQNYQVILPLANSGYKFGFINEPLCAYLIFDGSVSHKNDKTYSDFDKKYTDLQNIIINTLDHMIMKKEDKTYLKFLTNQKYAYLRALKAYDCGSKDMYIVNRSIINGFYLEQKLRVIDSLLRIPFSFKIHSNIFKLRRFIIAIIKRKPSLYKFLKRRINDKH